jgi:hypothetical protein
MFDNKAFGHFGAPETLSHNYGTEATNPHGRHMAFGSDEQYPTSDNEQHTESTPYIRPSGKRLPNLKGGATDQMVKDDRGIIGLVSEIQSRMGDYLPTGVITTSEIKAYQKSNGLKEDGIVGPKTYEKLRFKPPFGSSSRSPSSGSSAPSTDIAPIGGKPWYKSFWFLGTVTVIALGAGAYVLYPKGE